MFEGIALTDRGALAVGACIYLSVFLFGLISLQLRKHYSRTIVLGLIAGGFALQTVGLNLRGIHVGGCPLGNSFELTQFIGWSVVLLYLIIGPIFRLRLLGFFCAGLATLLSAVSLMIPSWDQAYPINPAGGNPWVELHAALAIFSYGFFAMVALVSIMFLIQQHGLKKKQTGSIYHYLPSIQQLDQMGYRLILAGVLCLTAALAFGAVFYAENKELVPVFKLTVTCLVWIGYSSVAILRQQRKLVTRRHALSAIALFAFALLSLWPIQSASSQQDAPTTAPRQE